MIRLFTLFYKAANVVYFFFLQTFSYILSLFICDAGDGHCIFVVFHLES